MADAEFDWGLLHPAATPTGDALISDDAILRAMLRVEAALILAWHDLGQAPEAVLSLAERVATAHPDHAALRSGAARDGNPVPALVTGLRAGADDGLAGWIHRGATSQDILDSALMAVAAQLVTQVRLELGRIGGTLAERASEYRRLPAVARTLGQHAGPTTFGVTVAGWLDGVVAADTALAALELPVQLGGSVGTGLAFADLSGSPEAPEHLRAALAARLGLADPGRSWHTERSVILHLSAALAGAVGALGRIGAQLTELSRTEIAEVKVGAGGSSAMPHKQNPVGPILLVAAAQQTPGLLATIASTLVAVDERPTGAWHAEWSALRSLLRLTADAASVAAEVVSTFTVDAAAMSRNQDLIGDLLHSESALNQASREPGAASDIVLPSPLLQQRADRIIDASLARFRATRSES
jgi:3-carboxy-cis,cis-muconate cycloisomerase